MSHVGSALGDSQLEPHERQGPEGGDVRGERRKCPPKPVHSWGKGGGFVSLLLKEGLFGKLPVKKSPYVIQVAIATSQ